MELYPVDSPGGKAGPNWLGLRVSFHSQFNHAVRRVALEVDTVAGRIHRATLVGGDLKFLARVVGTQLALDRVSARGEEGFVLTRPRREGTAHPLLGGKPCVHARRVVGVVLRKLGKVGVEKPLVVGLNDVAAETGHSLV